MRFLLSLPFFLLVWARLWSFKSAPKISTTGSSDSAVGDVSELSSLRVLRVRTDLRRSCWGSVHAPPHSFMAAFVSNCDRRLRVNLTLRGQMTEYDHVFVALTSARFVLRTRRVRHSFGGTGGRFQGERVLSRKSSNGRRSPVGVRFSPPTSGVGPLFPGMRLM